MKHYQKVIGLLEHWKRHLNWHQQQHAAFWLQVNPKIAFELLPDREALFAESLGHRAPLNTDVRLQPSVRNERKSCTQVKERNLFLSVLSSLASPEIFFQLEYWYCAQEGTQCSELVWEYTSFRILKQRRNGAIWRSNIARTNDSKFLSVKSLTGTNHTWRFNVSRLRWLGLSWKQQQQPDVETGKSVL